MKYCSECGTENLDENNFCVKCGRNMNDGLTKRDIESKLISEVIENDTKNETRDAQSPSKQKTSNVKNMKCPHCGKELSQETIIYPSTVGFFFTFYELFKKPKCPNWRVKRRCIVF